MVNEVAHGIVGGSCVVGDGCQVRSGYLEGELGGGLHEGFIVGGSGCLSISEVDSVGLAEPAEADPDLVTIFACFAE